VFPFADAGARYRSFAPVTIGLIVLNCLVFLYELQTGGLGVLTGGGSFQINLFFYQWGFIPSELAEGRDYQFHFTGADIASPVPTWATVFSSMFIHGGVLHLAGNMLFLWVFGNSMEHHLGPVRFLLLYLVTGMAAVLSHMAIEPQSQVPLIGASGAVSGILGAYLLTFPRNRIRALIVMILITVIEVPAMWLLGGWFLWQLFQGLTSLGLSSEVSVAFFAHVGGFAAGLLAVAAARVITRRPVLPRREPYWNNRWNDDDYP
jgi:membrane associated rhomboid family serine protease